jgi:4-hydroxy-3-methylbut-2-enyl diphosphate reductase
VKKIGITAGASTPAEIMKEVHLVMMNVANGFEEEINFQEAVDQSFRKLHMGEKVAGTVVAVNNTEAMVDIGTKHTGCIPSAEIGMDSGQKLTDVLEPGDKVDLIVTKINDSEGMVTLSKKKADEMHGLERIFNPENRNDIFTGTVQKIVKGGLLVSYMGILVFVPASHSGLPKGSKLDGLLKKRIKFAIIDLDGHRNKVVGSISAVKKAEREALKAKFWETAEEGKHYTGTVKSLTNYGAFVDLGGIDGMVHVSDLSWGRSRHPGEIVSVGEVLDVYIKKINRETGRVSLGYSGIGEDPWKVFPEKHGPGDVVSGKIVSLMPFGAFAEIMPGVDGLIHISQLSEKRVLNVSDAVKVGQEVKVRIIDIDADNKRVSLSVKALTDGSFDDGLDESLDNEPAEAPAEIPAEAPSEAPAETPAEIPAVEPSDAPAEIPAEIPAESPSELPLEEAVAAE